MVISQKVIKEKEKNRKKPRLVPEAQKGQHNRTKLLLITTFTETKGFAWNGKKKAYYYVQC